MSFLKAHYKQEAEERKVGELEAAVAQQQTQIEKLTAAVQQISAKVELSSSASAQLAGN